MSSARNFLHELYEGALSSFEVFSGATDIIVVKEKSGFFRSSPFHVRFGRFKCISRSEKVVSVFINGENVKDLRMKVDNRHGAAVFVHKTVEPVASEDVSSPISSPVLLPEEGLGHLSDEENDFLSDSESRNVTKNLDKNEMNSQMLNVEDGEARWLSDTEAEEGSSSRSVGRRRKKRRAVQSWFFRDWFKSDKALKGIKSDKKAGKGEEEDKKTEKREEEDKKTEKGEEEGQNTEKRGEKDKKIDEEEEEENKKVPKERQKKRSVWRWIWPMGHDRKPSTVKIESEEENFQYIRSVYPTEDQLKSLPLKYGENTIEFSLTSRIQGVQRVTAHIFLWNDSEKIVISDVDGTITKSDVFGQLLPMFGKDWTHSGISSLYTDIESNGYKFLYLTSRSIVQAGRTRKYIESIRQGRSDMPDGPLITSPDFLLHCIAREVIHKRPEEFKIAALREIASLFGKGGSDNSNPFCAGFGNKESDRRSYEIVDIPPSRIFIVDSKSQLMINHVTFNSYNDVDDIVNQLFPPLHQMKTVISTHDVTDNSKYSDFRFWRNDESLMEQLEAQILGEEVAQRREQLLQLKEDDSLPLEPELGTLLGSLAIPDETTSNDDEDIEQHSS